MSIRWPGKSELSKWVVTLSVGIIAGLTMGWTLWKPKPQRREAYAPPTVQKDGSVVLRRDPDLMAKPAQEIPKGAKVSRVIHVELQPSVAATTSIPGSEETGLQLPPSSAPSTIAVDLTFVQLKDGTHKAVVSSPDGKILASTSVDIPGEEVYGPRAELKWCAGGVYGLTVDGHCIGVFVDRDISWARVGMELTKNVYRLAVASCEGWEVRAKAGIRF